MNTKTKKAEVKNAKNINGGAVDYTLIDRVQVVKSRRNSGRFCVIVRAGEAWTTPAEIDITAMNKEYIKMWKKSEGETSEDGAFLNMGRICSVLGIALGDETIKRIKKAQANEKKRIKEKVEAEAKIIEGGREKFIEDASERAGKRFDSLKSKWDKAADKVNNKKNGGK
jgi:hypothetical protein